MAPAIWSLMLPTRYVQRTGLDLKLQYYRILKKMSFSLFHIKLNLLFSTGVPRY